MKLQRHTIACSMFSLLLTVPHSALAQQAAASTSTIYGRVTCVDNNGPARFGKVLLKSTQGGGMGDDFTRRLQQQMQKADKSGKPPAPLTDEQKRAQQTAARNMNRATDMLNASTIGLDGEYSFAHVKPGTYYVHASFPGYVDPLEQFSDDDLESTDPAVRARIAASVTIVTVSGTDTAHADLRLERGASVNGRLLFDDGSPAVGWIVNAIHPKDKEDGDAASAAMTKALMNAGASLATKTDDLGNYRIAGLPSGEYSVRASLNATDIGVSASNIGDSGAGINLAVYDGATFHRAEAKAFTLTPGENRTGVDLTVPSRKLHTIVGHVYAKADDHAINSGQVSISSKENGVASQRATIRDDGSFHYDYLPPGTYTIKVESAADAHTTGATNILGLSMPKQDILRKYGVDTTDVILNDADVSSVRLTVAQTDWTPPAKKPGADVSPGAALGGLLGGLLSGDDSDEKQDKPAPK